MAQGHGVVELELELGHMVARTSWLAVCSQALFACNLRTNYMCA